MGKLWQSCIKTQKLWSLCYFQNPPTNVKATHQVNSPTPSTHNVKMDLRSKGWVPNNIIKKISIQNSNYTQEHKYLCEKPFRFEGENYETNFESILLLSNQITIIFVYVS